MVWIAGITIGSSARMGHLLYIACQGYCYIALQCIIKDIWYYLAADYAGRWRYRHKKGARSCEMVFIVDATAVCAGLVMVDFYNSPGGLHLIL
jgi:hypothetical protein